MKYLLILLLVLVVIWAVKRGRAPRGPQQPPNTAAPSSPSEMVTCAHCGIHLPQEEAVSGQKGLYCGTEHRAAAQDRNPG
jgi:uncharacterized protein